MAIGQEQGHQDGPLVAAAAGDEKFQDDDSINLWRCLQGTLAE
jgi:hypothetical protein